MTQSAAAVKPIIDGIVDAGVILDDSPKHVRSITYHAPKRSDARRLVVLVREATATCQSVTKGIKGVGPVETV